MNILAVLKMLAKLELEMSQAYGWCANRFAAEEQVRELFKTLSGEELSHYDIVKYQERVVQASPKDFGDVEVDLTAINKLLAAITTFRATEPTIQEAIHFALDMETSVAEYYALKVMDQSNKNLAEMVKALANDDEGHRRRLVSFAETYQF